MGAHPVRRPGQPFQPNQQLLSFLPSAGNS
jgi:5'-3' exonuclease